MYIAMQGVWTNFSMTSFTDTRIYSPTSEAFIAVVSFQEKQTLKLSTLRLLSCVYGCVRVVEGAAPLSIASLW
jgi:hypothetical protein